jgi:hypothetical protein
MPTSVHSNPAPISYQQAQRAYFIHGALQDIKDVLNGPDDIFSRRWLLCHCGLRFTAKPMKLYAGRDQAEQALQCEARSAGITEHAASH